MKKFGSTVRGLQGCVSCQHSAVSALLTMSSVLVAASLALPALAVGGDGNPSQPPPPSGSGTVTASVTFITPDGKASTNCGGGCCGNVPGGKVSRDVSATFHADIAGGTPKSKVDYTFTYSLGNPYGDGSGNPKPGKKVDIITLDDMGNWGNGAGQPTGFSDSLQQTQSFQAPMQWPAASMTIDCTASCSLNADYTTESNPVAVGSDSSDNKTTHWLISHKHPGSK